MNSVGQVLKVSRNAVRISAHPLSMSQSNRQKSHCKVLVVGGGTGGCSVAAKLSSKFGKGNVIVLDPAEKHYYQPMFTLVGGGMKTVANSYKTMQSVLPKKAKWIQARAQEFHPDKNTVITSSGQEINYDILLVAMGLQLHYNKIPGLVEALSIPNGNVGSNYSPDYVDRTYESMRRVNKGNAVFTMPTGSVKCPGAPQKAVYISEDYFRKMNKRKDINVIYNTSLANIFGVQHYADALWKVVKKRDITVNLKTNLVEVKPRENIAVFANVDNPTEKTEVEYSMLHAVPPMSSPTELFQCKELVNEAGFVDVDKPTLQHVKYSNVFAIGDCSSSPNSKTAAAAAAQSPVVYNHIVSTLKGKDLRKKYDGYASCPLVTGYSKCILAEFDYDLKPLETFPFAQNKERYSMFLMKKDLMPMLYWQLMLKGYWNGPAMMRNAMSFLKFNK